MKWFSITIFLTVCFSLSVFAQCKDENCGLVVRGKVMDLQIDRSDKDYVAFNVNLKMEFKNESDQPIILFKPNTNNSYFGNSYYLGAKALSLAENGESLYSDGAWESIMGSEFYRKLAEDLDTKVPSNELTKVLQPNEVWSFPDKTYINFSAKEEKNTFPKQRSWKEMQAFPSKLWLTVFYELNPWNIEYFKPKLIRKLKNRWKNFGNVPIDEDTDSRFSHFGISSKPMMIDFSQAKEKISELEK